MKRSEYLISLQESLDNGKISDEAYDYLYANIEDWTDEDNNEFSSPLCGEMKISS